MTEKMTRKEFLEKVTANEVLLIYKVATTGLDPAKDRIIEFSVKYCVKDILGQYVQLDENRWYINPDMPLPEKVTAITGLTDEVLKDKPGEKDVIGEIAEYLQGNAVCGFNNGKFDDEFIAEAYYRNGLTFNPMDSIDTYLIAPEVVSPANVRNYTFDALAGFIGVRNDFGEEGTMQKAEGIRQLLNAEIALCNKL